LAALSITAEGEDKQGNVRIFRLCQKWFIASGRNSLILTCTGATISARANCTFDVKFEPISDFAPITYPGAITVTDSDNTHTQVVGLSGSGVPPIITSPQNVDFGTVIQGQSSNPQVVTVTNNHTTSETLSIATAGELQLGR
jgi:hypothetical protein